MTKVVFWMLVSVVSVFSLMGIYYSYRGISTAPVLPLGFHELSRGVRVLPDAQCNLDLLSQGDSRVDTGGKLSPEKNTRFGGWVVFPRMPHGELLIILSPRSGAPAVKLYGAVSTSGMERSDVVDWFKKAEWINSGFYLQSSLAGIPEGRYAVLVARSGDPAFDACDTRFEIEVINE